MKGKLSLPYQIVSNRSLEFITVHVFLREKDHAVTAKVLADVKTWAF